MKLRALILIVCISFTFCKKSETAEEQVNNSKPYDSVKDFLIKNRPSPQTFTINALNGGTYTTPQGTFIYIPQQCFLDQNNQVLGSGLVQITFLDIYKKSDMLLLDKPTAVINGQPLKSAGEFFLRATFNNAPLKLVTGSAIRVFQPSSLTGGIDFGMEPYEGSDTLGGFGWVKPANMPDSVKVNSTANYMYSMFHYSPKADSGTWVNSDNATYFSAFPKTSINLVPTDEPTIYGTQVFLVFKDITCMVHVYRASGIFPYEYAPQGFRCTLVAIGVKNGLLYSAFVPFTVSSNSSILFTLKKTTDAEFLATLRSLD